MAQHHKIVIIGAGLSGLAAAEKLQQKGLTDYIILEATDRVGGRLKTLKQKQDGQDYYLELGAGWIHGKKINPIYKLAKEIGLLKETGKKATDPHLTIGNIQYWEEGKIIGKNQWKEVKGIYEEALDEADKLFKENSADESGADLRTFVEEYVKQNLDAKDNNYQKKLKVLETFIRTEAGTIGCQDLSEVPANQVGSYRPGDNAWTILPRGYKSLTQVIKSSIPDDKILFNHPVQLISTDQNAAQLACSITCENGNVFNADHVIITISLGCLKVQCSTLFNPPLPQEKISAIQKLGFGTANRIYMEFENLDFLPEKTLGEVFLVRGKEETSHDWEENLYSFYCQEVPRANMLTTWLMGEHAIATEKLDDEEIKRKLQQIIQRFLKVSVPLPTRIIRTAWQSEPYVRGSWSYMKHGSSVNDIKVLAEPIMHQATTKPILLFAGEATHERFYSSTPGALLSGQREANRLLRIPSSD